MKQKKSTTFYCFSPAVMVATFIIEIVSALFVLYRYKRSKLAWSIVALLVCLGAFQLAEYFVCTNSSVAITAARLGFVAITFLPPLGLYTMSLLTGRTNGQYIRFTFVLASLLAVYFMLAPQAFSSYQCTGNYVIFQIGSNVTMLYSIYYFGLIGQSIIKGVYFLRRKLTDQNRNAVRWFLAGHAFFIVPVAVLNVFHPDTQYAIPSILCGFAVTLALVLVAKIAPLTLEVK